MAYLATLCTLVVLVAGSTGLVIRNEERADSGHEISLVVKVVSQDPYQLECTTTGSIMQYGVSYSKSYSLMAQGKLLAAEYKGETVECCIVDKSKLAEKSLTPCGDTVPTTSAPTTPEPTTPASTTPEPTTPEPTTPASTTPEPTTPDSTTPEPTTPDSTTPEPTTPASTTPEPTTPDSTTPEPTTPASTTPEPTTPASTTPEPTTPAPTTPAPTTTPLPYYSCPAGFIPHFKNGRWCFYFSTAKKRWFFASRACTAMNGAATLARPMTKGINNYIYNKVKSTGQTYWFDLTDIRREGTFRYSNHEDSVFTNWGYGEPSNRKRGSNGGWWVEENCAAYDANDLHRWNDEECGNYYRYVCQMDAIRHLG